MSTLRTKRDSPSALGSRLGAKQARGVPSEARKVLPDGRKEKEDFPDHPEDQDTAGTGSPSHTPDTSCSTAFPPPLPPAGRASRGSRVPREGRGGGAPSGAARVVELERERRKSSDLSSHLLPPPRPHESLGLTYRAPPGCPTSPRPGPGGRKAGMAAALGGRWVAGGSPGALRGRGTMEGEGPGPTRPPPQPVR